MKILKFKCDKENYKVVTDENGKKKCVKMSPEEIKKRKLAAKKAAIKRKSKLAQIIKKAQKTRLQNQQKGIKKVIKTIH